MDLQWLENGEVPAEDLDNLSRNLAFQLKRLVDERDTQLEVQKWLHGTFFSSFKLTFLFFTFVHLMKIKGSSGKVMWIFFPLTTKELLQEGRVETVTVMDGGVCVCACAKLRLYASFKEFQTHEVKILITDKSRISFVWSCAVTWCVYAEDSNSLQIITELHSRSQLKSYFLSRAPDRNKQCVGFCVPFIPAFVDAGRGL